jgi:tetratricopeptide (TPR) repeat protein
MNEAREIEFEFDEQGAGEFRPSGNAVRVIMDHLKREDMDQAASLLASFGSEVGDLLIEEARVGASRDLWRRLARLFGSVRDNGRAARCAEAIEDHELAGECYDAAYESERAAESFRKAGKPRKAAEMYERALLFAKAAPLYFEAGEHLRAAECYSQAGATYHAGYLYMKLAKYEQGVELLQRVGKKQQGYVEAAILLGRFFEKTGNADMALAKYIEVVRSRPVDAETVDVHARVAAMIEERGLADQARVLWQGVVRIKPDHEKAGAALGRLGTAAVAAPAGAKEPAVDIPPLVLPGDTGRPKDGAKISVMRLGFDVFRAIPIFSELSLDELRAVHTLTDRVKLAPGQVLIEQGKRGEALFVITQGKVSVEVAAPGKQPIRVAVLGVGATVGEMAMIDEGPTSARVVATEEVHAFKFPIARLNGHLAADPKIGYRVMRVLCRILSVRLREANRAMAS